MATKPSTLPLWATDTNLASGDQAGSTTKDEPPLGYKQQGCVPGYSAPGRYMNWLFNLLYQWIVYVDDLHNSADFLNKSYTWLTGTHRFTNGLRAAGVGLESGDMLYTNTSGASTPRSRTKLLRLDQACRSNNGAIQWSRAGAGNIYSVSNTAAGVVDIELPTGSVLQSIRAMVTDAGAGDKVSMSLYAVARNAVSGAVTVGSPVGGTQQSSGLGGAAQALTLSGLALTIDNVNYTYELHFSSSVAAGTQTVSTALAGYDDIGFNGNR